MKTIIFCCCLLAQAAVAQSASVAWSPSPDSDVTNYNVCWSTNGWPSTNLFVIPVGTNLQLDVSGIVPGVTYSFAANCENTLGGISDFSNVILLKKPNPPSAMATLVVLYGQIGSMTNKSDFFQLKLVK
jgi:hypothetical protein